MDHHTVGTVLGFMYVQVELGLPPASEARSDEEGGGQNLKVCLWSGTALDCHPDTVRARSALRGVLD